MRLVRGEKGVVVVTDAVAVVVVADHVAGVVA